MTCTRGGGSGEGEMEGDGGWTAATGGGWSIGTESRSFIYDNKKVSVSILNLVYLLPFPQPSVIAQILFCASHNLIKLIKILHKRL